MGRSSVLIVADPDDEGAVAVAWATATRVPGLVVEVVHPVELSLARWKQTVRPDGATATTVTLSRGRQLTDDDLAAVLVRSNTTPVPRFSRSAPADRDYAAAELRALLVSWLRGLGSRVVNTVDGVSLTGPSWTPRRWLVEAHRAGLRISPLVVASSARLVPGWHGSPYQARLPLETATAPLPSAAYQTLVVAGDHVTGAVADSEQRAALQRMAARAHCRLAEVECRVGSGTISVFAARAGATLAMPATTDSAAVIAVADLLAGIAEGAGP